MTGPVQILCEEIGHPFDQSMERPAVLVAFVAQLVDVIECDRQTTTALVKAIPEANVGHLSEDYESALRDMRAMLTLTDPAALILAAAAFHAAHYQPDEGPCDHHIDMLRSCASALRFGLETPCRSRHAAASAYHVMERLYLRRQDKYTSAWIKDWTRHKLADALAGLARTAPKE